MREFRIGFEINGFKILSYSSNEKINIECLQCSSLYNCETKRVEKKTCQGCGKNRQAIAMTTKTKKQLANRAKAKYLKSISTLFYKQASYLQTGKGQSKYDELKNIIVKISKGDLTREEQTLF